MSPDSEVRASATSRRLFFALWPSESLREQIGQEVLPIVAGRRARQVRLANLHITLAFLGAVPEQRMGSVIEAAAEISGEPFELTIDHLESWCAAQVACLTIAPIPASLAALVERLRFSLLARHLEPDQKEFRAHVTVAREWCGERLHERVGPFTWPVRDFVLVESHPGRAGSEYRIVRRWPINKGCGELPLACGAEER